MLTPEQEAACIRYNFDADSKGDSAVRVLDVRMVTAAKDHGACFPCLGPIAKGERHRVERAVMDGRARTCRSCATCCEAMAGSQLGTDHDSIEVRYRLGRQRADAARAPGAKPPVRVLDAADQFCPKCGHNRDTSSVSSVDLGDGRQSCQKCGAEWIEPAAVTATQAPRMALDLTLTKEEAEGLASFLDCDLESDDDTVRLLIGHGHSGYGLYAAHPEYPEEGAILVTNMPAPDGGAAADPVLPRRATDEEIRAWMERHDLGSISLTEARCVFEDAQSLHLADGVQVLPAPLTQESADRLMPTYGEVPWADLEAAIAAANGAPKQFSEQHHIGHQEAPINMNSLNRIVSMFIRRTRGVPACAPIEPKGGT